MPIVSISPNTRDELNQQVARALSRRDGAEVGRRMLPVERIQLDAAARVDAQRIVDAVVSILTSRPTPTAVVL